jgi:predicted HicB family RNase H-like nuclease
MLMQPTGAAVRKGQGQLKQFGGGVSNSAHGAVPRFANHQRQISAANTATNRESDKIIVRLPAGMRKHLAEMAARRGKSMNAEVVTGWPSTSCTTANPIRGD